MNIFKPHQVFNYVEPYLPLHAVIVEAGAFDGSDTIKMATRWPHNTIYTFEPVPQLFQKLVNSTAHLPNIHCYEYALSNSTGIAQLYIAEKPRKPGIPSQASSLLKPKERCDWSPIHFPHSISIPTITLDDWTDRYAIDHVDFLWLDIQGHELAVLKAAPNILKKIHCIYTEVSFIESYEHQPHYEAVKIWLENQGFVEIGRTFKNQSDWFFGNVLYVRK